MANRYRLDSGVLPMEYFGKDAQQARLDYCENMRVLRTRTLQDELANVPAEKHTLFRVGASNDPHLPSVGACWLGVFVINYTIKSLHSIFFALQTAEPRLPAGADAQAETKAAKPTRAEADSPPETRITMMQGPTEETVYCAFRELVKRGLRKMVMVTNWEELGMKKRYIPELNGTVSVQVHTRFGQFKSALV